MRRAKKVAYIEFAEKLLREGGFEQFIILYIIQLWRVYTGCNNPESTFGIIDMDARHTSKLQ